MGISPAQLIIVLLLVLIIFGSGKLRSLVSDLGGALKGFKKEMASEKTENDGKDEPVIENNEQKS